MDLETVLQLIFSVIFTAVIVLAVCIVCVPGMGAKRHLFIPGQKQVYCCNVTHNKLKINVFTIRPSNLGMMSGFLKAPPRRPTDLCVFVLLEVFISLSQQH